MNTKYIIDFCINQTNNTIYLCLSLILLFAILFWIAFSFLEKKIRIQQETIIRLGQRINELNLRIPHNLDDLAPKRKSAANITSNIPVFPKDRTGQGSV